MPKVSKKSIRISANAIRWTIIFVIVIGIAGWFSSRPDPKAAQRRQYCQSWGITDPQALSECGKSDEQEESAIAPYRRKSIEREIAEFNQDLATIASGKTRASETEYPVRTVDDVAHVIGNESVLGRPDANFPAKGQTAKITGSLVTHEPDPDEAPEDRVPRYYTLDAGPVPTPAPNGEISMPSSVNLDIESLNRYERQFIIDNCFVLSVTPCGATVLGHLDEIIGRADGTFKYVGIVADQLDIEPLTWDMAYPNGFQSTRAIVEDARRKGN